MAVSRTPGPLVAGVDLATGHARVAVADAKGRVASRSQVALGPPHRPRPGVSEQDARSWWPAVALALRQAIGALSGGQSVRAVAVSATSGTVVLADRAGEPIGPGLLYDDSRAAAPDRWDWLLSRRNGVAAAHAWHASDLVVSRLTGATPVTDWSHALKTGFDPGRGRWCEGSGPAACLRPEVLAPTVPAGTVSAAAAAETGLPPGCQVRLGMTDGCAAQLAAGADRPGRFVTVLGTTLVLKGASAGRVDDPASGVYSHRHPGGWWLPGGASNVGGASLTARYPGSLATLDRQAATRGPATAVCYPLARAGERFPLASAKVRELWVGEPEDDVDAYRAVLEGVAFVERLGYERLAALGAVRAGAVRSAGGGSASAVWSAIRATVLGVPIVRPVSPDTAFGACVLAATGTLHESLAVAADAMVAPAGAPVEPVAVETASLCESYGRFVTAVEEEGWLPWSA